MENSERETHDFMKVDSFSQLPFIRPAPVKEKGIRLFGIEFGSNKTSTSSSEETETIREPIIKETAKETENGDNNNNNNNRRFECHYCCRNFPTSQALGGHQNAHKRERQHAKRAHLQSAMAAHGSLSDASLYGGFMNYRTYPSWNNTGTTTTTTSDYYQSRLYGSHGISSFSSQAQQQQPINGSPLGSLWRIPSVRGNNSTFHGRDRSTSTSLKPLPLLSGEVNLKASQVISGGGGGGGGGSSSQGRYGNLEIKGSVQDHVSLDLHL